MPAKAFKPGWHCQECRRRLPSTAAAERAVFGPDGCPGCGGADIDYYATDPAAAAPAAPVAAPAAIDWANGPALPEDGAESGLEGGYKPRRR